ncbi:hypothetical protein [Nocardioides alkalitolerans]|uniref:SLAC1 family transporter n=1 Tax=Nocardioides alkalitolerans TaxID=281714 RepID=UPI0006949E2A
MATTTLAPATRPRSVGRTSAPRPPALGGVTPHWFTPVMGTGIVAVALLGLPVAVPGREPVALAVWLLAATLLVGAVVATVGHHVRHPSVARSHLDHGVVAHGYGAPPMALMTVGAGALLVGDRVLGAGPAVVVGVVLWTLGTGLGLLSAVVVPWRALTRHGLGVADASGAWLMSVVPPVVSAATGALLVPLAPAGAPRVALLLLCYALLVAVLPAVVVVLALLGLRLRRYGVGPTAAVPALWIVLGPLGQSVTAVHHLGGLAPDVLPAAWAAPLTMLVVAYGVPVALLGLGWLVFVLVTTVRAARTHLPFGLPWWAFTFPVGTIVTAVSGLATTPALVDLGVGGVLRGLAAVLFAGLVGAWVVVLTRTARGVVSGELLAPPAPFPAPRAAPGRAPTAGGRQAGSRAPRTAPRAS